MLPNASGRFRDWLETQGYPLELRTAREFQRAGAKVQTGQFYIDPDTDEPREIDVIATFDLSGKGVRHFVSFVVECKASERPWVLLTTPADASELPLEMRVFDSKWIARIQSLRWLPTRDCIDTVGSVAYSGVRALGKQDGGTADSVFRAILSATKAALWLSNEEPDALHIIFPVVVVDARLFSCSLPATSDDIEVSPIASGIPSRWARPGDREVTVVDVVVAQDLERYMRDTAAMLNSLHWELQRTASYTDESPDSF